MSNQHLNQNDLVIRTVRLFRAVRVLDKPISDATHTLTEISFIVMRIQLENGVVGESYLLSFQYSFNAILGALKDVIPHTIGKMVYETGALLNELDAHHEYFGQEGLLRWAQGAVNIAMWDAWGKCNKQPVWKMLGATRTSVPIYGSGGWISYTPDELIEEVTGYVSRGFKAVKIKVGSPDWKKDIERLKEVRHAVGNDINIMMDANQGMDVPSAMQLAYHATDLNIHWFEEPVHHKNFQGFQKIRENTGISLAMGEREYDTQALSTLAQLNAIDIWQPDILRLGGVEPWRKSAFIAEGFNLPVLPHYYKDYDVPLVCTINNGSGVESFDWIDPLIDNPMLVKEGLAYPHDLPGWGFMFKDEYLIEIK